MKHIEVICVNEYLKTLYTFYFPEKDFQKGDTFENQGVHYVVLNRTDVDNLVVKEVTKKD